MRHLIIGKGEVGQSLYNVLKNYYNCFLIDENSIEELSDIEIMHICFPFSEIFIEEVKRYQLKFEPKYTIIHSTVPVGTSSQCDAIHSPIIGMHPFLEESIKTFIKFFGGRQASQIADQFRKAGIKIYLFDKPETTELLKLLDTTYYGLCIEYIKEIKRLCQKNNIPFEAWTIYNTAYNQGYKKLGYPEYTRPNLIPIMKKIGGHCVLPNCELLDSLFAKFIQKLNNEATA